MIGPFLGKALERGLVAGLFLFPERLVEPVAQTKKIRLYEGIGNIVILMKPQQILIKPDRLDLWGFVVLRIDFPCHEVLGGCEDRTVGGENEGILRLGSALLPCGIKTQGIVNDEIIQGGTVTVGNGPRIEQKVIIFDPFLFEDLVMDQGLLELLVDFRKNPGQVPGCDIPARSFRSPGPLGKAPTISLKVLPVPVGKDCIHHRLKVLGSLGHLRLHPGNFFLGLVSFNGSLQVDLLGNAPDGHCMGLFLEGTLDQGFELLDRRLGQTLLGRLLDFFPLIDKTCGSGFLADQENGKGKKQRRGCKWNYFLHAPNEFG